MKKFWEWYNSSAHYIGLVVLFFVLVWALQKIFFTGSCAVAGWKCEYSFGADFMVNLAKADGVVDMVSKVRH